MAHINILAKRTDLAEPTLVEGLPGVGLVGKIAADHLVETFEMTHYANVHCDGIPHVSVYTEGNAALQTPVRLYTDESRNLVVLQSDVPVSPAAATEFAECMSSWFDENGVRPIFLSGLPREQPPDPPSLFGFATGDGQKLLDAAAIGYPNETGLVSGPTGALLNFALETGMSSVGLVVESDPQFPDPTAAKVLLDEGVGPLAGVEIPTDDLIDRAEEIRRAKERLAKRVQQDDSESTQAKPLRMYQ